MSGLLWWLGCAAMLDKEPPVLSVDEATGPVREIRLAVSAKDEQTGLTSLALSIDGGAPVPLEIPAEGQLVWTPDPAAPLPDGEHTFALTATDGAWQPNTATVQTTRTLDATPPGLLLAPSSKVAYQGRTWAVWVKADEPVSQLTLSVVARGDDGETIERRVPFYLVQDQTGSAGGQIWRALRGIELREAVGTLPVKLEADDAVGNRALIETSVEIRSTAFEEGGFIKLTKKQEQARKDKEAIDKMRAERNAAYAVVLPEQRWSGPFQKPVPEARLTSPFGKYRTYSDGRKSYHTGLDLGLERGVPVLSAAPGKVLVAHEMAIFGNVVIVHHGQGVVTSYNHLDAIAVAEGDQVEAGQLLGTLGSTGQSTGPHLHWGMEVAEVAVDPGEWLGEGFVTVPAFEE